MSRRNEIRAILEPQIEKASGEIRALQTMLAFLNEDVVEATDKLNHFTELMASLKAQWDAAGE